MREGPPTRVTAQLLDGLATAILLSKPYPRVIRSIAMVNSVEGGVTIYRGLPTAFAFVATSEVGNSQVYSVPFKLPSGQNCFVQWAVAPPSLADAQAVFTWMEEG